MSAPAMPSIQSVRDSHRGVIATVAGLTAALNLAQHCKVAVLASVYQYEGQLQVVKPGGACLRCLWPEPPAQADVGLARPRLEA